MAGRRRKVDAKNYEALIQACDDKIEELTNEIKALKSRRKQLVKDKAVYDIQKAEEEKAQQMSELADLMEASGKTYEDVKAFLSGKDTKTKKI